MSEVGINPGEMALSPNDLTNFPSQNNAERSPIERAVAAGKEFISAKTKKLKEFFFGPIPEAQGMAYLRMIQIMSSGANEESDIIAVKAKAKLLSIQQKPNQRKTVFEKVQEGEDGTE